LSLLGGGGGVFLILLTENFGVVEYVFLRGVFEIFVFCVVVNRGVLWWDA
jgi:hypothetical protein